MDQEKKRKVSVAMVDGQEQSNSDMAAEEIELSEEESKQQMRVHEEDFIQGLIMLGGIAAVIAAVLNGQEWTARMQEDDLILPAGEMAKVAAIEGVKLILVPVKNIVE